MECEATTVQADSEFLRRWLGRARAQHVPVTGGLELTQRCNLRCVHCYLRGGSAACESAAKELSGEEWCDIIDQAAAAGTLWLLLTGGEPLLRNDFARIYSHAKRHGLLVTVFTNATRVSEEIIELFRRLPPFKVEVSLYGATPRTYERITGVRGSYEHCRRGIRRLREAGVRLTIKTILMTYNAHEFADIERLAREYGEGFRFDPEIQPRLSGEKSPLALRLAAQEAVAAEFADSKRKAEWLDFVSRNLGQPAPASERLYVCAAGVSNFFVDAFGVLHPCLAVRDIGQDLRAASFAVAWESVGQAIASRIALPDSECSRCSWRMVCGACPAVARLESGSEHVPSPYQCARTRHRMLNAMDL